MEDKGKSFLKSVGVNNEEDALGNTIKATFQRNSTYKKDVLQYRREDLHQALREILREVSKQYRRESVDERTHTDNIWRISEELSAGFGDILLGKRFRIGSSQKALNLYLKFLWCLDLVGYEPPHCPIDGTILHKASIYESWTKLDSIETYSKWISKIRTNTGAQSLSLWELENWKR